MTMIARIAFPFFLWELEQIIIESMIFLNRCFTTIVNKFLYFQCFKFCKDRKNTIFNLTIVKFTLCFHKFNRNRLSLLSLILFIFPLANFFFYFRSLANYTCLELLISGRNNSLLLAWPINWPAKKFQRLGKT